MNLDCKESRIHHGCPERSEFGMGHIFLFPRIWHTDRSGSCDRRSGRLAGCGKISTRAHMPTQNSLQSYVVRLAGDVVWRWTLHDLVCTFPFDRRGSITAYIALEPGEFLPKLRRRHAPVSSWWNSCLVITACRSAFCHLGNPGPRPTHR